MVVSNSTQLVDQCGLPRSYRIARQPSPVEGFNARFGDLPDMQLLHGTLNMDGIMRMSA
jgi:hypothetical protein